MSVLIKNMEIPEHCGYCRFRYDGICHALQKTQYSVEECPLVSVNDINTAQRKGKWIATQEWGGRNYSCSCCKFSFMVDTCMLEPMWNFCPNCGAEMVKGEEDERIKNS